MRTHLLALEMSLSKNVFRGGGGGGGKDSKHGGRLGQRSTAGAFCPMMKLSSITWHRNGNGGLPASSRGRLLSEHTHTQTNTKTYSQSSTVKIFNNQSTGEAVGSLCVH